MVVVAEAMVIVSLALAGGDRVMIVAMAILISTTYQDSRHLNELRLVTS